MPELNLVMPMAGRGSRFERNGYACPKPLIELHGQPFFAWAVESLASKVALKEISFVVLREHLQNFDLERQIRARYPRAHVVALDEVTSGATETAALGVAAAAFTGPIAVNDCDHAFDASGIAHTLEAMAARQEIGGALLGFRSRNPGFSYVEMGDDGLVRATVEKRAVSDFAIAGCYLFRSQQVFLECYETYRRECPYTELFVSGMYNTLVAAGGKVSFQELARHVPFGTPEELAQVDTAALESCVEPIPARQ
ncbi:MAG: NTP transferase domain-containing protein [Proteobacteria bacterium]|nr:NTP transferase domain-containing protein [Pseudomonadota bacterium]